MSSKITGMSKLLNDLDARLGTAAMEARSTKALLVASPQIERAIRTNLTPYKVTGNTLKEMKLGAPKPLASGRMRAQIYWEGPTARYKLIHLNEWGTTRNPNPRAKGQIALALKTALPAYKAALKRVLEEGGRP